MGAATVSLPGWRVGAGRRLAGLAAARLANQAIGVVWFVLSARVLDERQFGIVGAALAIVVVVGALSDLGATRTLVRHIAAEPRVLWPAYRRALGQRLVAGSLLGALATAVLGLAGVEVPVAAIALAAGIALASGVTELAFAALRAVGLVRLEMALLVGERAAFAVAAGVLVLRGGGALPVLAAYLVTNVASAAVGFACLTRLRPDAAIAPPRLLDREGRRTAVASTLVTLGPRVSTVVLVVLASPAAVGTLTIAQKAPEAVGVFAAAVLAPVLAMVRPDVLAGDRARAARRGVQVLGALLFLLGPALAWMALRPDDLLGLVFDAAGRDGAAASVTACAVAAFLLLGRAVGEQLLLADDRAGAYVTALATGAAVSLATAVALVPAHGATGAAVAALAGEAAAAALVVARLGRFRASGARRVLLAPVALAVAVAAVLVSLPPDADVAAVGAVAVGSLLGAAQARSVLRENA